MGNLIQDVKYGARVLSKSPGFALVSVLTLALGIGANTAIFSVVSAVLVRPLGYPEAERLVKVWEDESANALSSRGTVAPANYLDWKSQNQSFDGMAASEYRAFNLTGDGEPERVVSNGVEADYFSLIGVRPALGRDFLAEEDAPGGARSVVLSHGLWQSRHGADPGVLDKSILLNGESYRVVGVMPAGFEFGGARLWVPLALTTEQLADRNWHNLEVVARLKPGVTAEQADADIDAITARIAAAYPDAAPQMRAAVVPLRDELIGDARRPLAMLLGAVGLVLLIACANTAGMLLARAAARRREIAVRCALGAGRLRIVRQLLTESLLLGAAGGVLGLLFALWSFAFLRQLVPAGMQAATELNLDAPVLLFTLGVSVLASLGFGLAPALQASRADLNDALKSNTARTGFGGQRRLRDAFVVSQVALSLVLLVGAGLLVKTLSKLRGQYDELRPERVLTVRTQLAGEKYEEHARRTDFYERVLARVRGLPGVEAAGYATAVPLAWKGGANGLVLEGRQPTPGFGWNAIHRQATPDYFRAVGVPVKEGRAFSESDTETSLPVAVINDAMARLYWPGESALGKRFKVAPPGGRDDGRPWLTIVGVVADVRQMGADAPVRAEMYIPQRQAARHGFFAPRDLVVRAAVEPLGLVSSVREAIREADPTQPVSNVRTMDELLGRETAQRRLGATLVLSFAALALLLSALGIYGVLAYFVTQHVPEIGVRLALGARPADILGLVLRRGMSLALIGLAVGLLAAYALTRLMQGLLFGVSATDPLTYVAVAALIATVALAACLVPARRAMKVDPMEALRYE
ncbi:MAG TPA: ABC transporter permease [Pyrinomonadaceae bacterium]|nr:ABC transporter permease [Pyrinomonadaceae bacterium]